MSETCYMCDAPETSREHAPPICLFPEKATIGRDLRRNLITVPSCDIHNSKKSKDDEFLRTVLTMAAGPDSPAASHQFFGKVVRAMHRQPITYSAFFTDMKRLGNDRALSIDRTRFDSCITHIAKAIYFHAYSAKWLLPMFVASPNFYMGSGEGVIAHEPSTRAVEVTKQFLENEPNQGKNLEVFLYRIRRTDEMFAFAALFYERFEIYAASSPELALNSA